MVIFKRIFIIVVLISLINGFCFSVLATTSVEQVIENGTYEIELAINTKKAVDISQASTQTGANVQIWDKCNGAQQRFQITYLKDGYYTIKNIKSGKLLDVSGAGKSVGTNVQQWESNSTDAQKWKIEKNSDGNFYIISKCNGLFFTFKNESVENGTNIEMGKNKQLFKFNKITTIKGSKTLNDGIYKIATALNKNKVIDISEASMISGANVQIWDYVNVKQQKFYLKYDGNGYYTIKSLNSGKVIDVTGAVTERGTNVQQWEINSTDAQKWVIKKTSDGYYNIISKVSGINLEVANSKTSNGTNIQINMPENSLNQKFIFTQLEDDARIIEDGTYEITTKISTNRLLDVSEGSIADGANVQIWADANVKQQKFEFTYLGGGVYKIISKKSGKALTVSSSGNVYQSTYKETGNQLWRVDENAGAYNIISEYNGKYLYVENGTNANGTNVRVATKNNANSQKFIIEKKKYGIDVSHWQNNINFDALSKSQSIDFMIIRAGQGINIIDKKFEKNYTLAKRYGIPLGVYLYANAQNVEEARNEANHLVNLMQGKKFELPVYYDVEAQENVDVNTITAMCNEFCKILKNAGYKTGIYASKYYLMYKIYPNKLPEDCSIWVASYGKNSGAIPNDVYKYSGKYDIWQYTSTGRIDGIDGDVDCNVSYKIP